MSIINTYGKDGRLTGMLIPLWHADEGPQIDQVYLTTILAGQMKGPHLHKKRRGLFYCIWGEATIVMQVKSVSSPVKLSSYSVQRLRPGDPPIEVPPGTPAALYNARLHNAMVLNMPSPPWRENDVDEWPVEDWTWTS